MKLAKRVVLLVALVSGAAALSQSLTLTNLKGPVAKASGKAPAKTIAELWAQIYGLRASAPVTVVTGPAPVNMPSPPTPTGMVMPTGTSVSAASLAGLPAVASGINVADFLQPSWGTGAVPSSNAPDVVGAFRFLCAPSHVSYDDPIVYPGQPGKSHLHTFFGNTGGNANSTYASLRASGDSTCNNLLNRSLYWMPSMMNGRGKVVLPNFVSIYYKRQPANDPSCRRIATACVPLPRGLRYIFGYNMNEPAKSTGFYVTCDGAGADGSAHSNIPQAAKGCPIGARLGIVIGSPDCWNGTELDSSDHRSHMSYAVVTPGTDGQPHCDAAHPYLVPQFTLGAWFETDASLDRSGDETPTAQTWFLSSDRMAGMDWKVPGTTMHTDWFGAWEDSIMDMWMAGCVNSLLNCSGGDLGNGKQMKLLHGYNYSTGTQLVDPPVRS